MEQFYRILGLSSKASKQEVKKAYRKLAMKYHPDRNPSPDAAARFQEITIAYDVILSGRIPVPSIRSTKKNKTPEEKWRNVQHPPKNKKDFEEWYEVKSKRAKRFDSLTFDDFIKMITKEEKNKLKNARYLFWSSLIVFILVLLIADPVLGNTDLPHDRASAILFAVLLYISLVIVFATGGYLFFLKENIRELFKKELRKRQRRRRGI